MATRRIGFDLGQLPTIFSLNISHIWVQLPRLVYEVVYFAQRQGWNCLHFSFDTLRCDMDGKRKL